MPKQPSLSSGGEVPIPHTNKRDLSPPALDQQNDGRVSPKPTSHALDQCNIPHYRFLSQSEWIVFAHSVGVIKDAEHQMPIYPKSWWWPPKGLSQGLYRDVVYQRSKSFYIFHVASIARWTLMILQLLLGATLTALGSLSLERGTPITILGAANTVIAGFLAFLHNSGLPDRYWYDMAQYEAVEDHIREILDASMIPADHTLDQALAESFDLYQNAKATVLANKPLTYTTSQGNQAGRHFIPVIPPAPTPGPPPTTTVKSTKSKSGGGSEAETGK